MNLCLCVLNYKLFLLLPKSASKYMYIHTLSLNKHKLEI